MTSAVIITTRNRADKLNNLLLSIYECSNKPDRIVIVSSGNDVSQITGKYNKTLNITHKHTTKTGQVIQRNQGINILKKENFDIVVFLDDDVTVGEKFFYEIEEFFKKKNGSIGGLGFKLKNMNNVEDNKNINLNVNKKNSQFGKVLTDGNAVDYSRSEKEIEVEWLNGVSAWRSTILMEFTHPPIKNGYAACEDLIFSYAVSRKYKLYFCPEISLLNQDIDYFEEELSIEKYKTWWQHKLYFVLVNKDLSLNNYILSLLKETIWQSMHINKENYRKTMLKIKVYLKLLKFIFFNRRRLIDNPQVQTYLLQNIL